MKIAFHAFQWKCSSSKFPLEVFLGQFATQNALEGTNRNLYLVNEGDLYLGLLLSIKDMRKFVTLVNSKQDVRLDVHKLKDNEKIADFNFFIVNTKTGVGLYQYYHNSCSLRYFCSLIKKEYANRLNYIKQQKSEELERSDMLKGSIKTALRQYNGKLDFYIIEREGKFLERVQKMQDAYKIECEFLVVDDKSNGFQPLSAHLKRHAHTIILKKTSPLTDKLKSVVTFLSSNIKKATVTGLDDLGNNVVYRMIHDFDTFKEFDYEDMVPSLRLNQDQIEESITENEIIHEL